MLTDITKRWESLSKHTSTLFFGAGILLLAAMSISQLRATTLLSSPRWLHNFIGPLGVAFTAYGLVVFYPWVADAAPRLARAGAAVSMVAGGAISVAIVGASIAAVLTGSTMTDPPGWIPILYFSCIVSLSVGFLLYGVASVRTHVPSRSVGLAMLSPAVLLFALFVGEGVLGVQGYLPRIVFIATPVYLLVLGYIVRTGTSAVDREETPIESPA